MTLVKNKPLIKIGLLGLIILQCLSFVWVQSSVSNVTGYSEIINIAGQQRMLTKHLGMLALMPSNLDYVLEKKQITRSKLEQNNRNILLFLTNKSNNTDNLYFFENVVEQFSIFNSQVMDIYGTAASTDKIIQLHGSTERIVSLYDKNVSRLVETSTNKQGSLVQAILGSFLLFGFIVYYNLAFLIKPRLVRDKKELQSFANSLQIFKSAFQHSNDAVLIFDSDWQLVEANDASFRLIDEENKSLIRASNVWQDSVLQGHKAVLMAQLKNKDQWRERLVYHKDEDTLVYLAADGVKVHVKSEDKDFYVLTFRDFSELQQKHLETEKMASTDALTGFFNRFAITKGLGEACQRAKKANNMVGVLFADLNGFKKVNDIHGHTTGDMVLKAISSRLEGFQRTNIRLGRYGGDEFVFIHENVEDIKQMSDFARAIHTVFGKPLAINNLVFNIKMSIGISLYPNDTQNHQELIRFADIAMYKSKYDEQVSTTFFTKEMAKSLNDSDALEKELKQSIAKNELQQVFQPIVDLASNKVIGMELLMRWHSKNLGLVSPERFIPVAEQTEFIFEMDKWSWLRCINEIKDSGWRGYISLNVSAVHFSKSAIVENFLETLVLMNFKNKVIFEITETAIIKDIDSSSRLIHKIKDYGHFVAIDDFGTGYSSLYYLKKLPIDYLKIDKSFVLDILENENSISIVRAIIGLASDLSMKVIVEGIENLEIEDCVRGLEGHYAQGFYYSKPIPFNKLIETFELENPHQNHTSKV